MKTICIEIIKKLIKNFTYRSSIESTKDEFGNDFPIKYINWKNSD